MDYPIHIDTISVEFSILYFKCLPNSADLGQNCAKEPVSRMKRWYLYSVINKTIVLYEPGGTVKPSPSFLWRFSGFSFFWYLPLPSEQLSYRKSRILPASRGWALSMKNMVFEWKVGDIKI